MSQSYMTWAVTDDPGFPLASNYGLIEGVAKTPATHLPPDAELAGVIDLLYQAAAGDDAAWEPALIGLRDAFAGTAGQICLMTPSKNRFETNLIAARSLGFMNVANYEDKSLNDPVVGAYMSLLRTAVSSDLQFSDEHIAERNAFLEIPDLFGRYLALSFIMGGTLHTLAVLRSRDDPPFTTADCSRYQTILADFDRIGVILALRRKFSETPDAAIDALDLMSGAFGLAKGVGELAYLNCHAQKAIHVLGDDWTADPEWGRACIEAVRLGRSTYNQGSASLSLNRLYDAAGIESGLFHNYFSELILVDFSQLTNEREAHLLRFGENFNLTTAEREVLGMLAQGHDVKTIADQRGTGEETVRTQLRALRQKTQLKRREQLVALATGGKVIV
jgi:DNA-binding CsgD family transcriptional regulator